MFQKHNYKTDEENLHDTVHAVGYLTAILGLVGIAYLGYKKRESICECWDEVKNKSNHILTPFIDGAKESKDRAAIVAKEKKADIKASLINTLDNLSKELEELTEEAVITYDKEISEIKRKINELKNHNKN